MAFYSLLALPAVLLWAAKAAAVEFPSTVEVDLIFPRNETYAPAALFPIVFAFQNAALAPSLDPGFDLTLWNTTGSKGSPVLDLQTTNFSGSDPKFVYTYFANLNTTDDGAAESYQLSWAFSAGNCSNEGGALTFGGGFRDSHVYFTIESGAQQPDLVAATADSALCTNSSHLAFNLTNTLDVALESQYDGRNSCAVFSDVQPLVEGSPCAVTIDSATASSISAAITATACAVATPVVSCPGQNVAAGKSVNVYYMASAVVLCGLAATFVAI